MGSNGFQLSLGTQPESPGEVTVIVTIIALVVVVRTLNTRSTLITKMLNAPYHAANSRHNVVQISRTHSSYVTETLYQY